MFCRFLAERLGFEVIMSELRASGDSYEDIGERLNRRARDINLKPPIHE